MPVWLDVSDAINEVSFQDTFDVRRRTDNVNQQGVTQIAWNTAVGVQGIVGPSGKNDLDRVPDGQRSSKTVTVVTNFRLQGPARGAPANQADVIVWPSLIGDPYLVVHLEDYSHYGQGFVLAVCSAITLAQPAPTP